MAKAKLIHLSFNINAPLDPFARGEHFEDPLYAWLEQQGAEIVDGGGGTMLHADGRVVTDLFVEFSARFHLRGAIRFVKSLGVPVGSTYQIDDGEQAAIGDCHCVEFSIKNPPQFGPKRLGKLLEAVEDAVRTAGKLLSTQETKGRLVFLVFGKDAPDICASMSPLVQEYSKYMPRIHHSKYPSDATEDSALLFDSWKPFRSSPLIRTVMHQRSRIT